MIMHAELNSKISYIMFFLHDYHLACEISAVIKDPCFEHLDIDYISPISTKHL